MLARAQDEDKTEVWPENWTPLEVFARVADQWIVGFGGPVAINHLAVHPVLDLLRVPAEDRLDVFDSVLVMSSEAIKITQER